MEWINVKDRLPETNQHCLTYNKHNYIEYLFYDTRYNGFGETASDMNSSHFGVSTSITHWMPLPEPPNDRIIPIEKEKLKCPICGSVEEPSNSPRTYYKCGSSDYDQRPNTFKQSDNCKRIELAKRPN